MVKEKDVTLSVKTIYYVAQYKCLNDENHNRFTVDNTDHSKRIISSKNVFNRKGVHIVHDGDGTSSDYDMTYKYYTVYYTCLTCNQPHKSVWSRGLYTFTKVEEQ